MGREDELVRGLLTRIGAFRWLAWAWMAVLLVVNGSNLREWMWLAAGGTALLAAGVVMERRGIGPVEGGRRLVDTVREGFA